MAYQRYPQVQGQGFYNPMMPGPDWGQGISQFLNQMTQLKEQRRQQEEEQSRWEQKVALEQEKFDLYERNVESQIDIREREAQPELWPTELVGQIKARYKISDPDWDVMGPQQKQTFVNKHFGDVNRERSEAAAAQKEEEADVIREGAAQMKHDEALAKRQSVFIDKGISRYETEKKNATGALNSLMGDLEEFDLGTKDPDPTLVNKWRRYQKIKEELSNVEIALDDLYLAKALLTGGRPLMEEEYKRYMSMVASSSGVKSGAIFKEMAGAVPEEAPPTKEGNIVTVDGKEYPLNPDGTVTINGQKFRVEKK